MSDTDKHIIFETTDIVAETETMCRKIEHGDIYRLGIESAVEILRNLAVTNPKFTVRIKSEPNNAETVLLKFIDIDKDGEDSDEW